MQPSEEIKEKLDIVDFIQDYIPLTAAGMNFRARCPFHNEKSPSFMVSPDKQIWHCFGCGKGGDIFKFIMELEGIEFVEALRMLAPKAGVTLKRQNPREASEKMRLVDIVEISRRFYNKYLLESSDSKAAAKYLLDRGLDRETIDEWQVGYSPDAWDGLLKVLKKQGYKEAEIEKTGMIIQNSKKNSYFDRFRSRIMFPINDANGNPVAFSARVSPEKEATEQMGKYVNSPQTILYNKSQILFGLDKARHSIRQSDQVIIVEGQMDVISAHKHGYTNVVASSGTALTKEQIAMLKRYTSNFALAFDADTAGQMAADRGIREALKQEVNIKVIEVPEGKDPDECIKNNPKAWEKAVKEASHMMDYYFSVTFKEFDISNIEGKRKSAAKLLPIIASIGNKIENAYWLRSLAEAIEIDEDVLREAIPSMRKKKQVKNRYNQNQGREETSLVQNRAEKQVKTKEEQLSEIFISIILKFFALIDYAIESIDLNLIKGLDIRGLYKNIIFYYNNSNIKDKRAEEKQFILVDFKNWLKSELSKHGSNDSKDNKYINAEYENQLKMVDKLVLLGDKDYYDFDFETAKMELIRVIISLKKISLSARMKALENEIGREEKAGNETNIENLMEELKLLSDESRELSK